MCAHITTRPLCTTRQTKVNHVRMIVVWTTQQRIINRFKRHTINHRNRNHSFVISHPNHLIIYIKRDAVYFRTNKSICYLTVRVNGNRCFLLSIRFIPWNESHQASQQDHQFSHFFTFFRVDTYDLFTNMLIIICATKIRKVM